LGDRGAQGTRGNREKEKEKKTVINHKEMKERKKPKKKGSRVVARRQSSLKRERSDEEGAKRGEGGRGERNVPQEGTRRFSRAF